MSVGALARALPVAADGLTLPMLSSLPTSAGGAWQWHHLTGGSFKSLVGGATGRPAQPLTQWQQLPENARSLPASPGPGRVPKCLTRLSTSRVVQRGKLSITPHSLL
jgi:hypothetical protein